MIVPADLSRIERTLLTISLVFIIILAVKMTTFIISFFITSVILAMLFLPAMNWLKGKGFSDLVSVSVITILACVGILVLIVITILSFHSLVSDIPLYQNDLNLRFADITTALNHAGITGGAISPPSVSISDIVAFGISGIMGIGNAFLFLFFVGVTTFFILLEAPRIVSRMEKQFGRESPILGQLDRMTGYITDFIVVRTETNAIHGLLFGGFLSVMGVHSAVLWGILTFLLGYIPYFGLVIAALPAIFFAWLQFGVPGAAAVIAAVCVLNLIVENPVYSYLAARKFEVPALIVILSVIFWGWLLGIIGMLFSIPITLMLLLSFEMSGDLRWINAVLGVGHLFGNHGREDPGPPGGPD